MGLGRVKSYLQYAVPHKGVEKHHYLKEALQLSVLELIGEDSELTESMVFQGGTALRLCYGLQRLSEDLDFVAGNEFAKAGERLKELIASGIPELAIKEKRTDYLYILTLKTPERVSLKVEIARVPSYEPSFKRLTSDLFSYVPSVWLKVETPEEVLADKVVAMGLRHVSEDRPFKSRDVWDIHWLMSKRVELDTSMVKRKVEDYGKDMEEFLEGLNRRTELMGKEKAIEFFVEEMRDFLYGKEAEAFSLHTREIAEAVIGEVERYLKNLQGQLGKTPRRKHRELKRRGFSP